MDYTFGFIVLNFFMMFFGIIAHFLKKKIKGETLDDIKKYFKNNFKSTVATVIAAIVLFSSLIGTGGLGFIASFTAGYACDSLFNRGTKE